MKYKNIFLAFAIIITTLASNAKDKVYVSPIETFSTQTPSESIDFYITKASQLGEYNLSEKNILHCSVLKVTKPKIGKRSATFTVSPNSYSKEGTTVNIEQNYNAKYSKKFISKEDLKNMDKKELGIKAATKVGGHFVKGVAPVVSVAEGMIKNDDGNRLSSGFKQLIYDSPLGLLRKGKQITITPEDEIALVFKPVKVKKVSKVNIKSEQEAESDNETSSEIIEAEN